MTRTHTRPHSGPDPTDEALVREAADGSRSALGELYGRHRESVFRLALRLTGSESGAEDILHDVFVGLPRALERYEERGQFSSWIRRVAARVALMRLRARRDQVALDRETFVHSESTGPVERVAAARAVAAMPEALRVVFLLTEVEGYSHRDVGELLDISVNASRTRLHRAWTFLHKRLGRES